MFAILADFDRLDDLMRDMTNLSEALDNAYVRAATGNAMAPIIHLTDPAHAREYLQRGYELNAIIGNHGNVHATQMFLALHELRSGDIVAAAAAARLALQLTIDHVPVYIAQTTDTIIAIVKRHSPAEAAVLLGALRAHRARSHVGGTQPELDAEARYEASLRRALASEFDELYKPGPRARQSGDGRPRVRGTRGDRRHRLMPELRAPGLCPDNPKTGHDLGEAGEGEPVGSGEAVAVGQSRAAGSRSRPRRRSRPASAAAQSREARLTNGPYTSPPRTMTGPNASPTRSGGKRGSLRRRVDEIEREVARDTGRRRHEHDRVAHALHHARARRGDEIERGRLERVDHRDERVGVEATRQARVAGEIGEPDGQVNRVRRRRRRARVAVTAARSSRDDGGAACRSRPRGAGADRSPADVAPRDLDVVLRVDERGLDARAQERRLGLGHRCGRGAGDAHELQDPFGPNELAQFHRRRRTSRRRDTLKRRSCRRVIGEARGPPQTVRGVFVDARRVPRPPRA